MSETKSAKTKTQRPFVFFVLISREYNYYSSTNTAYIYDDAGNIDAKYVFNNSTAPMSHLVTMLSAANSTVDYSYNGDRLTNYNGTAISYDTIGNPTKWRNAIGMSWDARSLETVVLSNGDTVYYTYNSSGIRTQKRIVSSTGAVTTHDYLLDGTNILKETVSGAENYVLEYLYDESGVAGIKYNGAALYFIKNLQGDVIALTDDSAIKLVQYTYDAWGNVISITGSLASLLGNINPIRYRSYYYDIDTGYYYLNSRYYDPTVGRFLNGDAFLGINGGIQGYNMYAYCNNNPVAYSDSTGTAMVLNVNPDFMGNTRTPQPNTSTVVSETEVDTGLGDESVSEEVSFSEIIDTLFSLPAEEFCMLLLEAVFHNISADAGICIGIGGSVDIDDVLGLEGMIRADIVGIQFRDGQLSFGSSGRSARTISIWIFTFGLQCDNFEDYINKENKVRYEDVYFDIGLSYGKNAAFGLGYHYNLSVSFSGILSYMYEQLRERAR